MQPISFASTNPQLPVSQKTIPDNSNTVTLEKEKNLSLVKNTPNQDVFISSDSKFFPRGVTEKLKINNIIQDELDSNMLQNAISLSNIRDKEMLAISQALIKKDDNYRQKTYATAVVTIPLLDSAIKSIKGQKQKLSGTFLKTAILWTGAFALAGIYDGAIKKVAAVTPKAKEKADEHPVLASVLRLAGFAALLYGTYKGGKKLIKDFPKIFPKTTKKMQDLKTTATNNLKNSKLNNKVYQPVKKIVNTIVEKHHVVTDTISALATVMIPILAIGSLFKMYTDKLEATRKLKESLNKLAIGKEIGTDMLNTIEAKVKSEIETEAKVFKELYEDVMPGRKKLDTVG